MIIYAILVVLAAYLIGSISFAVIFTKTFSKKDIRDFGSKNAGATNAVRIGGKKAGALTFLCDLLKGTLSAFLGDLVFSYVFAQTNNAIFHPAYGALLCGVACMLGHVFPVFFGFRGGKGVATGVGIIFAICPIASVCGLLAFVLLILFTKIVSISSLLGTLVTVTVAIVLHDPSALFWPQCVLTALMGIIIFLKHLPNIDRLLKGEEKKLSLGGKKNG